MRDTPHNYLNAFHPDGLVHKDRVDLLYPCEQANQVKLHLYSVFFVCLFFCVETTSMQLLYFLLEQRSPNPDGSYMLRGRGLKQCHVLGCVFAFEEGESRFCTFSDLGGLELGVG